MPNTMTTTTLTIKRRGRGDDSEVNVLGTKKETPSGAQFADVQEFTGKDIEDLLEFAKDNDIDPTFALATGINTVLIDRTRKGPATLRDKLLAEKLADNPDDARQMAIYLRGLAKRAHLKDASELIDTLRELRKAS